MYFADLTELWHMGGHGFYVWSAYGISAVVLSVTVWNPLARGRRLLDERNRRDDIAADQDTAEQEN